MDLWYLDFCNHHPIILSAVVLQSADFTAKIRRLIFENCMKISPRIKGKEKCKRKI
jgi:hypothetical protein